MKLNHFFGISLLFYRATHLAFADEHHGHEHRGGHEHHDGHEHKGRHLEGGRSCGTIVDQTEKEKASVKAEIGKWLATNKDKSLAPVEIETIIHVVYPNNNPSANEVYENEQAQVDVLNDAFSTTRFSFKLVEVQVHNNIDWWFEGINVDSSMKTSTRSGTYATLNVWFNTVGNSSLGYATYPQFNSEDKNDGVVCLHSSGPGGSFYPYNEGDTLVHEVGHWMHLYHTFEGLSCSGDGDQVADTPTEAKATGGCPLPNTVDTCPNSPGFDSINNYMNYVDDLCMFEFTEGQKERMDAAWDLYRAPYVTGDCTDGTLRFKITKNDGKKIMRDCAWVAIKAGIRCSFTGVPSACPSSCGTCSVCEDSTLRFKITKSNGKKIMRDCGWVSNKNTVGRCALDGVSLACRDTCGTC